MFYREFFTGLVRIAVIGLGTLGAAGCSVAQQDSFTLITELPPGFKFKGEASYVPRTGKTAQSRLAMEETTQAKSFLNKSLVTKRKQHNLKFR
ncbi:hypothetical protein RHM58_26680 [Pseudomonas sp. 10S4]|uniref:hypothetical protein n=1 Tax=Pseudomonas sp. 10S4 TaxID=3048583 RepID=UPI002AC8C42E|nr:hypothetical protein [Pseudomonas sp. 10S4]WPX17432.1 hypothetical protein RHM58_26680 [Pseudomonas sp. 10S4]